MKYSLIGVAVLAALLVACSKPKEEQGAMSPAGSDVVAPQEQSTQNTDTGKQQAPAQAPAPAPSEPASPAPGAPAGDTGNGTAGP